jgi:hypothetical protein
MEAFVVLVLLCGLLLGVFRLFRFWATRTGPEAPGVTAALLTIGLAILSLAAFAPEPVRVSSEGDLMGTFGMALGGAIARAIVATLLMGALALTALLAIAMGLGIHAGLQRRPAMLDSDQAPR